MASIYGHVLTAITIGFNLEIEMNSKKKVQQ